MAAIGTGAAVATATVDTEEQSWSERPFATGAFDPLYCAAKRGPMTRSLSGKAIVLAEALEDYRPMATRRIIIRTQVRVQVRRTVRWQQTITPIYQPAPSLPTMRTTAHLPAVTTQRRRVISTFGGNGGLDDLYVAPPSAEREWDVFVSYAGEDKATASELAAELEALDIRAWFAKTELTIGMGLRRSIDYGLAHSRFGAVLMSHAFFRKEWPQRELDGIVALQVGGRQRVLPIWHGLSHDDMLGYSPTLADTVAARTSDSTIKEIAAEIARVVRGA